MSDVKSFGVYAAHVTRPGDPAGSDPAVAHLYPGRLWAISEIDPGSGKVLATVADPLAEEGGARVQTRSARAGRGTAAAASAAWSERARGAVR
ncbi:hypothetical protein OG244_04400 [Streptomyces brevispora]|uniref:hypothetical protein n=1 Tax=Streptomyces brevispora TaxID=887462 RepID=UPI002E2EAC1F|nr:hypothetical protein [Streptomyces brevispora]